MNNALMFRTTNMNIKKLRNLLNKEITGMTRWRLTVDNSLMFRTAKDQLIEEFTGDNKVEVEDCCQNKLNSKDPTAFSQQPRQ